MEKLLKDILREQMQTKGYTVSRVRRETGIAERYISAFIEGDTTKLPPAPYVRGYLLTIAKVLELNGTELWENYEKEGERIKSSGPLDTLPLNRFAMKKLSKGWIILGIIVLSIAIYGALSFNRLLGVPSLTIEYPGSETTITSENPILLIGRIDPRDSLLIGAEEISTEADGSFSHEYALEPGLNAIEFVATKLLGREHREVRNVVYEPSRVE